MQVHGWMLTIINQRQMNKLLFVYLIIISLFTVYCGDSQSQSSNKSLSPTEFSEKINSTQNAQLVDVRTSEEFSAGHLQNAINMDWYSDDFQQQISFLEKDKPVFVYCRSGSRSASAAAKMRAEGYEVIELTGGTLKWNAANLPVVKTSNSGSGMSMENYSSLLNSEKLVLIDFYAEWCLPCKKMEPALNEISKDMPDQVEIIRINIDENPALVKELNVDAIPLLHLYKQKNLVWSKNGYTGKAEIEKNIKAN